MIPACLWVICFFVTVSYPLQGITVIDACFAVPYPIAFVATPPALFTEAVPTTTTTTPPTIESGCFFVFKTPGPPSLYVIPPSTNACPSRERVCELPIGHTMHLNEINSRGNLDCQALPDPASFSLVTPALV